MESNFFCDLLKAIPEFKNKHARTDKLYQLISVIARDKVLEIFSKSGPCQANIGDFGEVKLPYVSFGNIDSTNLFDLDELIIFSYYQFAKNKYKNAIDIGANIGMHSILLGKLGLNVRCYEPDERHFKLLNGNIKRNNLNTIEIHDCAVSDYNGAADFIRVNGNTTSSHIKGAKKNPYGSLEQYQVKVVSIKEIIHWADLLKIDAEGEEAKIICATQAEDWRKLDALVEVGSLDNAKLIYSHARRLGLNLFTQKIGWEKVSSIDDMPISYKEGTLFLTMSDCMWSC